MITIGNTIVQYKIQYCKVIILMKLNKFELLVDVDYLMIMSHPI